MRFLCLHGMGSNARIFKQQTAAIRYELGDHHSYDFVEGTVPWEADPAFKDAMLGNEQTFSYCDPSFPRYGVQVIEDLERYLEMEGPYDGIMGFSLGANIALSWMISKYRHRDRIGDELPFKVGVFFSNSHQLYDPEALERGRIVDLDLGSIGEGLDVPTVHIWGSTDPNSKEALKATLACCQNRRSMYIHDKGHEISTSSDDVIGMVKVINRAIASV